MYKTDCARKRFIIGTAIILFSLHVNYLIQTNAPLLMPFAGGRDTLFYRNIIGSYLSFFIPANLLGCFSLTPVGGFLTFAFCVFSIMGIALKHGIFYYNVVLVFCAVSALAGYRICYAARQFRNQCLARRESFEVEANTRASKIREREKDIGVFLTRVGRYAALKGITEGLSATLHIQESGRFAVEETFKTIGKSDRTFLFLIDEGRQELVLSHAKGAAGAGPAEPAATKRSEIFDRWIVKQRRPLIVEDLDSDFRFSADALADKRDRYFKSTIGVPLMSEKRVLGVLRMDSKQRSAYTQDDLRLLGIIGDVTAVSLKNCILYQRTNELAIRDGLTGLYVQRYFKEKADDALKKAAGDQRPLSIIMIDIDHFKECNDRYGHTAGDIILTKISYTLRTYVHGEDIASRYGGEEFTVLFNGKDKREAIRVSESIRQAIEESSLELRRQSIRITVSIGVASAPEDGTSYEALVKAADGHLYRAKEGGRNRVWPQ